MYILFDIGATTTRVAAASQKTKPGKYVLFPTNRTFSVGIQNIISAAKQLKRGMHIRAIAGGAPGSIDRKRGELLFAPNLRGWMKRPISKTLHAAFRAPVFMQNDTSLVGLGEATFGAGRGKSIVAYITISTGVNGARIVNGHIDVSASGFEIGHQIIMPPTRSAPICPGCKTPGHLEALISGKSFRKRFHKSPHLITNANIWRQAERNLSYGLNNTIVYWSPDIIVLGGSMMKSPGIELSHVRQELKHILQVFPKIPPIARAKLGDIGGLYGALAYAQQMKP